MSLKPEERLWLEELADQYEEWAENPPMPEHTYWMGRREEYTCFALERGGWGFAGVNACEILCYVWRERYGLNAFPAGPTNHPARDDRRFEFCHYMAELIRDYLKTGSL